MSDHDHHGAPGEGEYLAAEYVLGLLDAEARRAAKERLARDPGFASEVAFWEDHLAGLTDEIVSVPPPDELWQRIRAATAQQGRDPIQVVTRPARPGLWQNLAFWRGLAFAALLLAAGSLALVAHTLSRPAQSPPLVATLASANGAPAFIVTADADRASAIVVPAALGAQQRTLQLWLIPPDNTPRSLGLIDPARPVSVPIPASLLVQAGNASVAVSIEPPGGSPSGRPTGPVIAQGKFSNL